MTPYRDRLENYNRATHSDALREMQVTPLLDGFSYRPIRSPWHSAGKRDLPTDGPTIAELVESGHLPPLKYVDPVRPTPARIIRSMETLDLFVSIATAALLVIVIPMGLLVLSVIGQ